MADICIHYYKINSNLQPGEWLYINGDPVPKAFYNLTYIAFATKLCKLLPLEAQTDFVKEL